MTDQQFAYNGHGIYLLPNGHRLSINQDQKAKDTYILILIDSSRSWRIKYDSSIKWIKGITAEKLCKTTECKKNDIVLCDDHRLDPSALNILVPLLQDFHQRHTTQNEMQETEDDDEVESYVEPNHHFPQLTPRLMGHDMYDSLINDKHLQVEKLKCMCERLYHLNSSKTHEIDNLKRQIQLPRGDDEAARILNYLGDRLKHVPQEIKDFAKKSVETVHIDSMSSLSELLEAIGISL